jgi:hypothetical protein
VRPTLKLETKKAVVASPAPQLLLVFLISCSKGSEGAGSGPGIIKVIIKSKACLPNLHANFPSIFNKASKTDL